MTAEGAGSAVLYSYTGERSSDDVLDVLTVNVPEGVTNADLKAAFLGSYSGYAKKIILSSGIKKVPTRAFENDNTLIEVVIENANASVSLGCCFNCPNVTSIKKGSEELNLTNYSK